MNKLLLFLSLFLLFAHSISAQKKYERKISISEWVKEMVKCKEKTYYLENAEITFDYQADSLYRTDLDSIINVDTIKCFVEIQNCKFPTTSFAINGLYFEKYVFLMQCEMNASAINKCYFMQGIEILWGNLGLIFIADCEFSNTFETYEADISVLQFSNCTFNVSKKRARSYININSQSEGYKSIINIASPDYEKRIKMLNIDSCQFNVDSVIPVINLTLVDFNSLAFSDTDFKNTIVNFETSSVEKTFTVTKCKFNQPIGMSGFHFPEKGTNFHWDQIKDVGFAIYSNRMANVYTAAVDSQMTDVNKYNELVSAYKQMYSTYRVRGDMESANNCYIAMKDVETRRLAYLHRERGNLTNYFNWKLNQFLKFFCKYGTSPIRALIISMWVILGFALVYFFFDSEWDRINRKYLLNKYKAMLSYFQSDKKLADYYAEKYNLELDTYNEFKEYLRSSEGNIPKYMLWLGRPLYRFPTTRRMLTRYIYSKVEILDGEWNSLKPRKKIYVNMITAAVIVFFVIYAFIAKAINSLFLSINTFSTLGFGSIPVKGISRYLAILQGFLGWFLLSIFSVSLINQILQS